MTRMHSAKSPDGSWEIQDVDEPPGPILTQLPGFGRPMNYYDNDESEYYIQNAGCIPFPNALNPMDQTAVLPLTTLREFTMMHIMNYITDQSDWRIKVFSEEIVYNWKRDILGMPRRDISRPMIDWVFDELRYKAKIHEDTGAVVVYTGHIVKSETIVPESLKLELQAAVAALEDVPDWHKDWHPGSNSTVLDLVHPSLYPLVFGRTRVLETGNTSLEDCIARCGEGQVTQIPSKEEIIIKRDNRLMIEGLYSQNFQWLPCMVDISGKHAKITSYINNLHPVKYKGLYGFIERVIDAAIPLWNISLKRNHDYLRIQYRRSLDDLIEQPEPGVFKPPPSYGHDSASTNLKDAWFIRHGLQIIVKLTNIQLTPENPSYEGGSWHVDGQLNDHICATAQYYYSDENIETSYITFRQMSATKMASHIQYESNYHDWLPAIFGCEQGESGVQVVGSIETREGRLLTFPNIFQHEAQPFSLVDPKKPGHHKILTLYLVDPSFPILSTANVPCQQRDWWKDHILHLGTGLDRLPVELQDAVFEGVTDAFPLGLDEAKDLRLKLMDDRKALSIKQDAAFKASEFSLF